MADRETIIIKSTERDIVQKFAPGQDPATDEPAETVDSETAHYYALTEITEAEALAAGFDPNKGAT